MEMKERRYPIDDKVIGKNDKKKELKSKEKRVEWNERVERMENKGRRIIQRQREEYKMIGMKYKIYYKGIEERRSKH